MVCLCPGCLQGRGQPCCGDCGWYPGARARARAGLRVRARVIFRIESSSCFNNRENTLTMSGVYTLTHTHRRSLQGGICCPCSLSRKTPSPIRLSCPCAWPQHSYVWPRGREHCSENWPVTAGSCFPSTIRGPWAPLKPKVGGTSYPFHSASCLTETLRVISARRPGLRVQQLREYVSFPNNLPHLLGRSRFNGRLSYTQPCWPGLGIVTPLPASPLWPL